MTMTKWWLWTPEEWAEHEKMKREEFPPDGVIPPSLYASMFAEKTDDSTDQAD